MICDDDDLLRYWNCKTKAPWTTVASRPPFIKHFKTSMIQENNTRKESKSFLSNWPSLLAGNQYQTHTHPEHNNIQCLLQVLEEASTWLLTSSLILVISEYWRAVKHRTDNGILLTSSNLSEVSKYNYFKWMFVLLLCTSNFQEATCAVFLCSQSWT